ncbi:MAG TPA: RluA family pseudouridine synthase [Acidobacteriota bacterium]|nr:RluA family pseudouridine synthase [Acidobacteriota bacterium]
MDESKASAARFKVGPAFAGIRLDQFLQRMIPRLSRNRIQKAIDERVRLTWDAPVKASTPVREGESVIVDDPVVNEQPIVFAPTILFEDDDLLAIDKPPGIVVHPTHSHLRNTVITLLRKQRNEPSLTLAHRLDAETSGVLLLGRHTWAARKIQAAFQRGQVHKAYLALVQGHPAEDHFEVDLPLGPLTRDSFVFRQAPDGEDARASRTIFTILERGTRFSLVRAELLTGRRHQIRAHLAAIGHPVAGDKLYGLDDRDYRCFLRRGQLGQDMLARLGAPRTMLHSCHLELCHPRDAQRRIVVTSPMPGDMATILAADRTATGEGW